MCGTTSLRCLGRIPLRGRGWTCREAVVAGTIPRSNLDEPHAERRPGWSAGEVLRCPRCRNVVYLSAAAGFPWRRCVGPAGCGHEWNPEAQAVAA